MSTSRKPPESHPAVAKYATRFYLETTAQGQPLEPTDANLTRILEHCALRPRPELFAAIRHSLAEQYGITATVEEIIEQTTHGHLLPSSVAALNARATSELMDYYRQTLRLGGEPAGRVRDWIKGELLARLGLDALATWETRAANEARERSIRAREARAGDVYVTRSAGLYLRRRITRVKQYRSRGLVQLVCEDATTPLLGAGSQIVVERDDDHSDPEPREEEPERSEELTDTDARSQAAPGCQPRPFLWTFFSPSRPGSTRYR